MREPSLRVLFGLLATLIGGATVLALGFWTAAAISRRPGQGVQD